MKNMGVKGPQTAWAKDKPRLPLIAQCPAHCLEAVNEGYKGRLEFCEAAYEVKVRGLLE